MLRLGGWRLGGLEPHNSGTLGQIYLRFLTILSYVNNIDPTLMTTDRQAQETKARKSIAQDL